MYPYVQCSIIFSGQDMETIKVSFDRWLDKEDVVCIYYPAIKKKRWNTAIFDNMGGSWEHQPMKNKSDALKKQEPYDFTHVGYRI